MPFVYIASRRARAALARSSRWAGTPKTLLGAGGLSGALVAVGGRHLGDRLLLDALVDRHPVLGVHDVAPVEQPVLDAVLEQHPVADPGHAAHLEDTPVRTGGDARQVGPGAHLLVPLQVDRGQDGGGHGGQSGSNPEGEISSQTN